jgi:hypothetical protein
MGSAMEPEDSMIVAAAEDNTVVAVAGKDSTAIAAVVGDSMAVGHLGIDFELPDIVLVVVDCSIAVDAVGVADLFSRPGTPLT